MKKGVLVLGFAVLTGLCPLQGRAQAQEAMQLALNLQKLNQLRKILQNMYEGYQILVNGYNKVKGIAEGNYKIHNLFLDGLMQVSPAVKNYRRVADIIDYQQQIIKEGKRAWERFQQGGHFSENELAYLSQVYAQLGRNSLQNLDALILVVTARQLRMSDAERIEAIDRLFARVADQLSFLRHFNEQASLLALQRKKDHHSLHTVQQLTGTR